MTVKEIREYSGLSRSEFSRTYEIPLRTLEDWESEKRNAPNYVIEMLRRIVVENEELKSLDCYSENVLHELGYCYAWLLYVLTKNGTNPYYASDIFPIKYFIMVYKKAVSIGIPAELDKRIGQLLNTINTDQWGSLINAPVPMEKRSSFFLGIEQYKKDRWSN